MELKRAVVTGLGALTPLGNSVKAYWDGLIEGKSGAAPITKFDASKFKTRFACEVKGFDPLSCLEKSELRKMDLFTQYALVSVAEAIGDAALDLDKVNKDRVGVIWGTGQGGFLTFQQEMLEFAKGDGTPRMSPFFIPKILVDIAAGWISMRYGFRGPNFATVSACATSNTAIIEAMNYIQWGKADMIVTGGSEASITEAGIGGFGALKGLSTRNDDPSRASRPFDTDRDGFVMGEGAGALIIEEYGHAMRRGARIYAEVVGGGMSADAYHLTSTHPEGAGAILGMRTALEEAGLRPEDVDYLNPHATSTGIGDLSEIMAVTQVFGGHVRNMAISATKSATGHLLGAAGAIEAIASIKVIEQGIVPPTINTTVLDPAMPVDVNIVLGQKVAREVNVAMSNTFGFGGHNASVIFKKVV